MMVSTQIKNYPPIKKTSIYKLGIDVIKKFIKDYQVECELNECGKYFASTKLEDEY